MLDRWLKPRTENPDPEIRKQAFAEVDPDHPSYKEAVRFDKDASVRASLLSRLQDLDLLAVRCHEEADEAAAGAAQARHCALLSGAVDGPPAEQRIAHLAGLDRVATLEAVVLQGDDARVRDAALSRLLCCAGNCDESLVAVASNDADIDLRSRAVDLLSDPDALDKVAVNVRKSDKDLHRRARDKIRAIKQNEENEHTRQQLVADILELAQRPLEAQNDSLHRRMARLQHWRDGWTQLALPESEAEDAVGDALATIEARLAEVRATVTARRALVEEISALSEIVAANTEREWRQKWTELDDHRDSDHREFERALNDCAARQRQLKKLATARTGAVTLLGEWEGTDWEATVVDDKRRRHLDEHWKKIALPEEADAPLHARYAALRDRLRDLQARQASIAKKAADDALSLLDELAAHLEAGRSAEATSAHDRLNHRLSQSEGLPDAAVARIRKRLAQLEPELRKLKEWRHWGADQAREQLCAQAEALAASAADSDASKLANEVKALRTRWQKIDKGVGAASAARWKRFDTACEAAYAPAKVLFDKQAAERKENAVQKRALCDRIEAYARDADWTSPDWQAATRLLDECRGQWRKIGPVNQRLYVKLQERYRRAVAAVDEKLKDEREREKRRRELAIAALKKSSDSEPLATQINEAKRVQREWRPSVRLRRKEEQALWESLREVCDAIFAKRDERYATRREEESTSRDTRAALCDEIDKLLAGDDHDEAAVNQAAGRYEQIRREWRAAGAVAPKQKAALERRYKKVGREFELRRDAIRKREHGRHTLTLLERALLVDAQRQRLAGDAADGLDEIKSAWDALPATRGAFAKKLDAAYAAGAVGDASLADNLTAKRDLCLRLELLADVPSPAEFQGDRMALKIAQLKDALSGGSNASSEEALLTMLGDWFGSAPVADDEWATLRERFESAARALIS